MLSGGTALHFRQRSVSLKDRLASVAVFVCLFGYFVYYNYFMCILLIILFMIFFLFKNELIDVF